MPWVNVGDLHGWRGLCHHRRQARPLHLTDHAARPPDPPALREQILSLLHTGRVEAVCRLHVAVGEMFARVANQTIRQAQGRPSDGPRTDDGNRLCESRPAVRQWRGARLCRDRRRTAADGAADHTSRLSDRGHCPLTRYGGGNAQHSGLRGHGNRHIQPMGRRMSGTTEPRDSLVGSSRRCSRSMGASSCAIPQPHWIGGLDALQELTQSGGVPV